MRDTPPSDTSPCVVIMLCREVKLCAADPACVAIEHRSSPGAAPATPVCAVLAWRAGWEWPLAMLLASFAAAPRLPVLLMELG